MAILIPAIGSCVSRMTPGEKRFAYRLEDKLEDDYRCWYDVSIGERTHHSDFVVFHPGWGLLVLEVKDWKLDTINSIDKRHAAILTDQGIKHVANPQEHGLLRSLRGQGDPRRRSEADPVRAIRRDTDRRRPRLQAGMVQVGGADDPPRVQFSADAVRRCAIDLQREKEAALFIFQRRRASPGPHHDTQTELPQHRRNPVGRPCIRGRAAVAARHRRRPGPDRATDSMAAG
jgi:hypothetical protein